MRRVPTAHPVRPLFLGWVLTEALLALGYTVTVGVLLPLHTTGDWLMSLVHSVYSMALIGIAWYGLGRFIAALPRWATTLGHSRPRATLHYCFAFLVAAAAITPAGAVLGFVVISGGSRLWEWPLLIAGIGGGHLAWNWAEPRADRAIRRIWRQR